MAQVTRSPLPPLPLLPALADLHAYRIFGVPKQIVTEMIRTETVCFPPNPLYREFVAKFGDKDRPDIMEVMILIQTCFPSGSYPALEHVWLTKGMDGRREDIFAFLEEQRRLNRSRKLQEGEIEKEMESAMIGGLNDFQDLLRPTSQTSLPTGTSVAPSSSSYTDAPAYDASSNPILDFFNKR